MNGSVFDIFAAHAFFCVNVLQINKFQELRRNSHSRGEFEEKWRSEKVQKALVGIKIYVCLLILFWVAVPFLY